MRTGVLVLIAAACLSACSDEAPIGPRWTERAPDEGRPSETLWSELRVPEAVTLTARTAAGDAPSGLPEGAVVERLVFNGPAGYRIAALYARPATPNGALAVIAGRAKHGNLETLQQVYPVVADGYGVVVVEAYRGDLPARAAAIDAGHAEVWRRERAVRSLLGVFDWAGSLPECEPGRRFWLGFSRGSSLVVPAAARFADPGLVVLVSPVNWAPDPGVMATTATRSLQPSLQVAQLDAACLAVSFGSDDPGRAGFGALFTAAQPVFEVEIPGAGHVFDFAEAWNGGLAAWVEKKLGGS